MHRLCLERQWTGEILREGNPYGQECVGILQRRLDLSWAGRTGTILIKRAGRGALPGGEQPVNKDVEWGAGVGCFWCMRIPASHCAGERGAMLGKLDWGDLVGMTIPIWGAESFEEGKWNERNFLKTSQAVFRWSELQWGEMRGKEMDEERIVTVQLGDEGSPEEENATGDGQDAQRWEAFGRGDGTCCLRRYGHTEDGT